MRILWHDALNSLHTRGTTDRRRVAGSGRDWAAWLVLVVCLVCDVILACLEDGQQCCQSGINYARSGIIIIIRLRLESNILYINSNNLNFHYFLVLNNCTFLSWQFSAICLNVRTSFTLAHLGLVSGFHCDNTLSYSVRTIRFIFLLIEVVLWSDPFFMLLVLMYH